MNFPHMKDNDFPYVNNVDVYKFQNDFNYGRWNGVIKFKMMNVLWNSTYNDVPWFETDEARDAWFDTKKGILNSFESAMQITPETTLKVPVPYNDAFEYNYLMVEMPMQTSTNQPIDYTSNKRIARWYFFIESATQFSPSTTELTLSLDYWTTFVNKVEIPYLMLNRGHAPMTMTTVEKYLSNPIANNEYLLADDFNYGTTVHNIVSSTYVPVGNGRKYVVFVAPYTQDDFELFGGGGYTGNSTPPTFSSIDERWGWMMQVNGYEWKYGNADYSDSKLPIESFVSQNGRVFNGVNAFAIPSENATAFFKAMATYHVNFIHGIQACFVLDSSMFLLGNSFNYRGYTLYNVTEIEHIQNFTFSKSAFEYDSKYANIAKLYTSPYAYMEITDDDGNYFTVNIENCGRVQMHREVSLAFPFIRYNIFFTGIDGDGSFNYTWRNLNNNQVQKTMWESDFARYMFNWDIPTYGIYVSSENEYAANNAAGMAARRQRAITDYENATRFANNTWANVRDSMATQTANVAASGETNTTNVNASTTTMVNNTNASSQAAIDNNITACNTATTNMEYVHNIILGKQNDITNKRIENDRILTNSLISSTVESEIGFASTSWTNGAYATVAGGVLGTISSTATGAAGGAMSGGPGGAAVGATLGAVSGVASQAQSFPSLISGGANIVASVGMKESIANQQISTNTAQSYLGQEYNNQLNDLQKEEGKLITQNQNTSATSQTKITTDTNNANADRTKATDDANASRTQVTNNANASRTQSTETNNASETDTVSVIGYQNDLKVKQLEAESQYENARLQKPVVQGLTQGNAYPDIWERRGIRMNIRTQNKSAIAQAGDAMLRFGYAIHRVWDMAKGFHYGKHFTYWKADDVWINDGAGVANVAVRAIGKILTDGVTVWRNPDEIGTIGIYDNI